MHASSSAAPMRGFRYYDLLVGGMVAVLLCSNLIGPAKVCTVTLPVLGAVSFGAGNLFFPASYIFGDVLTEVYGYARARRAIWAGFGAMLFATAMSQAIIHMPPSPTEPFNAQLQPALEIVFGGTWRIALASIVAYWLGDFANSFVLARMKLWTRGRMLWTRTIGSTLVGQGVDSLTFYPIAFIGIWEGQTILAVIAFNWAMKVAVEVVFTPLTYAVVGFLKSREGVDTYDEHTHFTPFSLKDEGEVRAPGRAQG
ncbi:queuosine precursor transporter [Frateuria sp. MAH-13]|uniref:Probable queuosine precursor transporter n=1 Tax=Frateuria flava TaxID=2821489 RepID=A0ABS4DKP7_9GAMM|nr:queuosine precursor transporter [Frateuria flava]MBP1473620.1 queuosine precursor transporter [Frateuria flava]